MKLRGRLLLTMIAGLAAGAAHARAAEVFRDDFAGGALDTANWNIGTWQLGRTRLNFTPQVIDGMVRLRHDTYNPSNPGGSFRGSEIWSDNRFERGAGLEFEARVRTPVLPNGLVTSFFTYQAFDQGTQTFADEIDFEFLSKHVNASGPTFDPVLATTWNNYNVNGSNFGDPNVHSSLNVNVNGLDLTQFNTVKIRWLADRVQWYVNGVPIRTAKQAVPDIAAPIRANFWAPGPEWPDAYASSLQPVSNPAQNTTHLYDIDYIAVRTLFDPVSASAPNRVFTDRFKNGSIADSDSHAGFWAQRNQGTSTITENTVDPLKLRAAGAGFPHAQVVSAVRGEFNFFESPITIEATGIGFHSTTNSYTKSILRFALSSQTLASGAESEFTAEDALALRIQGDNRVTLGFKLDAPNANTEFNQNLVNQLLSGPVRNIKLTVHPTFYELVVGHDVSETDSTQTTDTFTGSASIPLEAWKTLAQSLASGDAAMFIQSQLNNSAANENATPQVDSVAVTAVQPTWSADSDGDWHDPTRWGGDDVPNYTGANAKFTGPISAPRVITMSAPATAGRLIFDSTNRYTVAGPATLTLHTPAREARIDVLGGSHTVAAPLAMQKNTTMNVAPSSVLTIAGDAGGGADVRLTKTGAGALEMKHARVGSLSVSSGQLRILPGGQGGTSRVGALTISPGATFDLVDHDLIVDYAGASPLTSIAGYLAQSLLTSSAADSDHALGFAEASLLGLTSFSGETVDDTSVLVKFTLAGDTNLDGTVNLTDFNRLAANFGGAGRLWFQGDFNYDGTVNLTDFNLLAGNFGQTLAPVDWSNVPEPAALGWIAASWLCLKRRTRMATN
jgi:beta-glucanase (GH16 family)